MEFSKDMGGFIQPHELQRHISPDDMLGVWQEVVRGVYGGREMFSTCELNGGVGLLCV
jgi:hypothetical protein